MLFKQTQLTDLKEPALDTSTSTNSENQSSASRSAYQMPPPFVPANQQQNPVQNNGGYHGYIAAQQGYGHNGSSMSNGYSASNRSSPAPMSGGFVPPMYQQQPPQYQQHPVSHAPHLSNGVHPPQVPNGYPATGVPRLPPGFNPMAEGFVGGGPEWFGPRGGAHAHIASNGYNNAEAHSTSGTPIGLDGQPPSTPRSLHGSQASFSNDREGGYYASRPPPPGPPGVLVYATNGVSNTQSQGPSRFKFRRRCSHEIFVRQSVTSEPDDYDFATQKIREKFGQSDYSDFTLFLSYTDGRASPTPLHVHGLIIDRSATLKAHIKEATQAGSQHLSLKTNDRFITNEGFFLALQRLYCESLLDHYLLADIERKSDNQGKDFDPASFALSYAASGHLLELASVVNRGVDLACWLLNFNNIERVLDFAIDGGLEPQWYKRSAPDAQGFRATYGPVTNKIISKCLMFLTTNFPQPLLTTDFSSVDAAQDTRLPSVPGASDTLLRSTTHNPRLNEIKFGDHDDEEPVKTEADANLSVFSRLLLNLPFNLLTSILERVQPGTVLGMSDPSIRYAFMSAVVNEREKRRLRVRGSGVSNDERQTNERIWKVVGWEEKVENDAEFGPHLSISWVGFEGSG